MTGKELREKYINFFVSKGHKQVSGKSLIPENDPTVLFTTAGMHPLVPYLLGQEHPAGKRLVNYQKCIRTGDIDSVGDATHLTFFEMLGNWSLGDYFKEEALAWSYEFLTSKEWLGIDKKKLSVTVFEGEEETGVPPDTEAIEIWKKLGIPEERIYMLPREDNWWGPAGETGPCGPDSEMFIDVGKAACKADCKPGCSCGKYIEIWNDVFMQYNKQKDGTYEKMARPCVDTGMGLERTVAIMLGKKSVYDTEFFIPILKKIEQASGLVYGTNEDKDISMRIIADHVKASVFMIGDPNGIKPSNLGQGYILRRLIRRAIRHGRKLGVTGQFLSLPAGVVIEMYGGTYPELLEKKDFILKEIEIEEERFSSTLAKGEAEFEKMVPNILKGKERVIPGRLAFRLYDTFGFPIEITQELAAEHGLTVDTQGFDEAARKHQELSKMGADKVFKGGLADSGEITTKYHTATHLLHKALRMVLGDHVQQKGSNITSERLRFDFAHEQAMTPDEIKKVEDIVNRQIEANLPIAMELMSPAAAKEQGALAFFENKYEEEVKVYNIGDFSKEVCGGPHVERTGVVGKFKITKEQSSSAGVRRIRGELV